MSSINYQIQHIQQIIPILKSLSGQVLLAVDWDNCISLTDGCDAPLRDPIYPYNNPFLNGNGHAVHHTFNQINAQNIPWFIITARLHGNSALDLTYNKSIDTIYAKTECFNRCIIETTNSMHEVLPELSKQTLLKPPYPELGLYNSIIYNNIVFAGGKQMNNKHHIIRNYIQQGRLGSFDYLVFIDNDYQNIVNMAQIFTLEGIRNHLITIYYPQFPVLSILSNQNTCYRRNIFGSCIKNSCQ